MKPSALAADRRNGREDRNKPPDPQPTDHDKDSTDVR